MRGTLVYDFPLEGYMAQLVLPRDLTELECAKLSAFLKTLAVPEKRRHDIRNDSK